MIKNKIKIITISSIVLMLLYSIVVTIRLNDVERSKISRIVIIGSSGLAGVGIKSPSNRDILGGSTVTSSGNKMEIEFISYKKLAVTIFGTDWEQVIEINPGEEKIIYK